MSPSLTGRASTSDSLPGPVFVVVRRRADVGLGTYLREMSGHVVMADDAADRVRPRSLGEIGEERRIA